MADPLYQPSRDQLLADLRLSDAETDGTAQSLINAAIRRARVTFYRRLGVSPATTIAGYTYSEAPTTTNGVLRLQASELEAMLVRRDLLRTLPVLFEDAAAEGGRVFQGEEPFHESTSDRRKEIERLDNDIEEAFALLTADVTLGEDGAMNTFVSEFDPGTNPTGDRIPGNRFFTGLPLEKE